MKKVQIIAAGLVCLFMASCSGKEEKAQVQLPDLANMFVQQNFSNDEIKSVGNEDANYQVEMADGVKMEFNNDGMWTNVKCADKKVGVPSSVLPYGAQAYLAEIYTEKKIDQVERDIPTGFIRVTLDDGLEIVFDADGQVI